MTVLLPVVSARLRRMLRRRRLTLAHGGRPDARQVAAVQAVPEPPRPHQHLPPVVLRQRVGRAGTAAAAGGGGRLERARVPAGMGGRRAALSSSLAVRASAGLHMAASSVVSSPNLASAATAAGAMGACRPARPEPSSRATHSSCLPGPSPSDDAPGGASTEEW